MANTKFPENGKMATLMDLIAEYGGISGDYQLFTDNGTRYYWQCLNSDSFGKLLNHINSGESMGCNYNGKSGVLRDFIDMEAFDADSPLISLDRITVVKNTMPFQTLRDYYPLNNMYNTSKTKIDYTYTITLKTHKPRKRIPGS